MLDGTELPLPNKHSFNLFGNILSVQRLNDLPVSDLRAKWGGAGPPRGMSGPSPTSAPEAPSVGVPTAPA